MEYRPPCHISGCKKVQLYYLSLVYLYQVKVNLINVDVISCHHTIFNTCRCLFRAEDSVIVGNNRNHLTSLSNWLAPVAKGVYSLWKRCWHASVDGWAGSTFHSRCDGKGPTVTIIRVGKYIFGGYTNISWGKLTLQKYIVLLLTATSFVLRLKI